jgi:hypothetical protein
MSRPFAQTMQVHQLDVHRLWLVLLLLSGLLLFIWASWVATDNVTVYEQSSSIKLTDRVSQNQNLDEQGNVYRLRTWRHRFFSASFPDTARGKLRPGQSAIIFLRGEDEPKQLSAVLTEVDETGGQGTSQETGQGTEKENGQEADQKTGTGQKTGQGTILSTLRVDLSEDDGDPFAYALPDRAKVVVGTVAPISLLFSGKTPGSQKKMRP